MAQNATVSNSSVSDGTELIDAAAHSATCRLTNTLLVTFLAVFLGFASIRLQLIKPQNGDMRGFGFFIGQLVFPLLIFKTVATARLGDVDWSVLLACTLGKAGCMLVTWLATYFCYRGCDNVGQRILNATVFTTFVMASNDFAIGFPVVEALYGSDSGVGVYIAANALVGAVFLVPSMMILFVIGSALKKSAEESQAEDAETASTITGRAVFVMSVVRDILLNPVIFMTLVGLIYKVVFGFTLVDDGEMLSFPAPLSDALNLVTGPFGMCALFLTGTTLTKFRFNSVAVVLVVMKILISPFVTYFFALKLTSSRISTDFAFLYGQLPTSSAPLVFAGTFAPEAMELLASGILLGLVLVGPLMYTTALFQQNLNAATMTRLLIDLHLVASAVGFAFAAMFLLALVVTGVEWGWGKPMKTILAIYGASIFVYELCMVVFSPQFDEAFCCTYNKTGGLFFSSLLLGWLQYFGQLLILGMFVLLRKWLQQPQGDDNKRSLAKLELLVILGSALLAIVPARTTMPSTVNEMCAEVQPPLASRSLVPNLIWTSLSFFATPGLYMAIYYKVAPQQESLKYEDEETSGSKETAMGSISAVVVTSRSSLTDRVAAWQMMIPEKIVQGLFFMEVLRMLMQCVNTFQVYLDFKIKGSVAQTLILEHMWVLLAPAVFALILLADQKFSGLLMEVCPRRLACGCLVDDEGWFVGLQARRYYNSSASLAYEYRLNRWRFDFGTIYAV
eukprot:TRINITY_DN14877_c0_g1_i1.p1 TRINITY_DN14877_c0_g1~~TRINITY_DN14877_c0_g1_i1.p1  ORF type:complete len:733 (-),score=120.16 TRINITY_DN14877_c0_g1_i1:102-2300(-)